MFLPERSMTNTNSVFPPCFEENLEKSGKNCAIMQSMVVIPDFNEIPGSATAKERRYYDSDLRGVERLCHPLHMPSFYHACRTIVSKPLPDQHIKTAANAGHRDKELG
ncbi:hypothetical protein T265_10378 [Opisthorchis viverrini]|uniref:Uncharacterized protein n=1 Tax=Opisthorchis viverrini TaxID=6198 RepID=A0A074Z2H0_OPIVI|nr:hypothetical protein T265_10378 [Opisthorchis viverrini]KER21251.1 hypothetical protein T265_10378 [Opisthorchis viverrini]